VVVLLGVFCRCVADYNLPIGYGYWAGHTHTEAISQKI